LHKRFCQVAWVDKKSGELLNRRVDNQDLEAWEGLFSQQGGRARVAVEATGNWMWLADLLEGMGAEVNLAHPLKVRLIAESRLKNDRVDAETLLRLLEMDWLPKAYLATPLVRRRRQLLRLRQGLVRMRTEVKNRIHALLARHNLQSGHTDLFGRAGRRYLEKVELPLASRRCRQVWLELLDVLESQIKRVEKWLYAELKGNATAARLETLPGVGKLTAYLLLAEIGPIGRFSSPQKLASYTGLVPSTRASAGKVRHGRTGPAGRSYLKWALVEAAHVAVRHDPYFASMHARLRRSKGAGKATVAVARKMAEIIWWMLKQKRPYIPKAKGKGRIRVGSVAPVTGSR
jgi:transposase